MKFPTPKIPCFRLRTLLIVTALIGAGLAVRPWIYWSIIADSNQPTVSISLWLILPREAFVVFEYENSPQMPTGHLKRDGSSQFEELDRYLCVMNVDIIRRLATKPGNPALMPAPAGTPVAADPVAVGAAP